MLFAVVSRNYDVIVFTSRRQHGVIVQTVRDEWNERVGESRVGEWEPGAHYIIM